MSRILEIRRALVAWVAVAVLAGCAAPDVADADPVAPAAAPDTPAIVVLGSAQDGGVPHAACGCPNCRRARSDPEARRRGPSIAIVVPGAKPWIVDASPDLPAQLAMLGVGRNDGVDRAPLSGVFLTHAHIGHYLGLAQLGREVAGTRELDVYATPAMASFLATNAPWDQLVRLGNVVLRPSPPGTTIDLGSGVRVTSFSVPHRDEYADTVGYRIEGPDVTVLYVPDTDRWESWNPPLEDRLAGVDVALLDATFHSLDELPGRRLEDVPHPPMVRTAERLQSKVDGGLRVVFTHLNHSNPAADPGSRAAAEIRRRGFEIARDGDVVPLTRLD